LLIDTGKPRKTCVEVAGVKMFNFFNICRKNEIIIMIAFCNAAGQCVAPVVKYVDMKQETADGFLPGSDWYTTGNGCTLMPTLFLTSFTEHCLKQKFSWKVILLLDDHRALCNSPLMLHTAVQNNTASFVFRVSVLIRYCL